MKRITSEDSKKPKKCDLSTVHFVPTEPKVGSMQKDGIDGGEGGNDIEGLGGLNKRHVGNPLDAEYPQ